MEATRIIAIRHGETDWNADGRIQGQLDIALNQRGRWQAARLASALGREAIEAVYTSDLQRAHATANPLADALGVAPALNAGLRERGFGAFEGRTFPDIREQWPDQAQRWSKRDPDFVPEGGESLLTFRDRVIDAAAAIAARHSGRQIALVSHGGVLDVLYRAATRQELQAPRSWDLSNAAINRLLWSPQGFSLVGWADTSHLTNEPLDETTA